MSGWFSLEAVYAKKGDALILHYGPKNNPRWILIDGGHTGVYENSLRPRLEELRQRWPHRLNRGGRLDLDMVMVSHADNDHLEGLIDLARHMNNRDPGIPSAPVSVGSIWFNAFKDLIAAEGAKPAALELLERFAQTASTDQADAIAVPIQMRGDHDVRAVVAATKEGRELQQEIRKVRPRIKTNPEYRGRLVTQSDKRHQIGARTAGLTFRVLGPTKVRIDKLRAKWAMDLPKIIADEKAAAKAASFADSSPFNLSSIIVLAERGGRRMLLSGDARGDDIRDGLKAAKLLDSKGQIHVDLFKLPHHGSDRNVKVETFKNITAMDYVISANGENKNPDTTMLDMLVEGRGQTRSDDYRLHLTFVDEAFKEITRASSSRRATLKKLDHWLKTKKPDNMTVIYRDPLRHSVVVDLDTESVSARVTPPATSRRRAPRRSRSRKR